MITSLKKSFSLWAAVGLFCVITLLPIVSMYVGALFPEEHFSLESYSKGLLNRRQLVLLKNSFTLALGVSFFSVILGVPFAFLIARTNIPFRSVFKKVYLIPFFLPSYITGVAWIQLLGQRGSLNVWLMRLFHLEEPFFSIYGLPGVIFVLTLNYFPCVTLLTLSGLEQMDGTLEEAAALYSKDRVVFVRITLPLLLPHILSGALFTSMFALNDFGLPALLDLKVFPVEIFTQFSAFFDTAAAAALSLPLIGSVLLMFLLQRLYVSRKSYTTISAQTMPPRQLQLGRWKYPCFLFCALVISLAVVAPLLMLLIQSASLETYRIAWTTGKKQIMNSLWLAALGATGIVGLGFFLAYLTEKTTFRGRGVLDMMTVLPYAVPSTIVGIGLIQLWNRQGLFHLIYGNFPIIIFGYVARFIPFGNQPIIATLKQLDPSLEEASENLGATFRHTIIHILLPLMKPGLLAGWTLAFVLCMGELGTTILVYPSGLDTLPLLIFNVAHYGPDSLLAALCLILIVVTLLPLLCFAVITREKL
jgi:iron(III) transport system permease protein